MFYSFSFYLEQPPAPTLPLADYDCHQQLYTRVNRSKTFLPLISFQLSLGKPLPYFLKHFFSDNCYHMPDEIARKNLTPIQEQ